MPLYCRHHLKTGYNNDDSEFHRLADQLWLTIEERLATGMATAISTVKSTAVY